VVRLAVPCRHLTCLPWAVVVGTLALAAVVVGTLALVAAAAAAALARGLAGVAIDATAAGVGLVVVVGVVEAGPPPVGRCSGWVAGG